MISRFAPVPRLRSRRLGGDQPAGRHGASCCHSRLPAKHGDKAHGTTGNRTMVTGRRMDLATPGNAWTATTSRAIPGSLEAGPGDLQLRSRSGRRRGSPGGSVGVRPKRGRALAPLPCWETPGHLRPRDPVVVEASCDHIATVVLRTIWRYWPRVGKPNLCPSDCRGLPLAGMLRGEMAGGKYACQ